MQSCCLAAGVLIPVDFCDEHLKRLLLGCTIYENKIDTAIWPNVIIILQRLRFNHFLSLISLL